MSPPIEFSYASFLIRMWRQTGPLDPDRPVGWQSEVKHIQSGQQWEFSTLEELLNFMRQQSGKIEAVVLSQPNSRE